MIQTQIFFFYCSPKCAAKVLQWVNLVFQTLDFDAINEGGGSGKCRVNANFDDELLELKNRLEKCQEEIDASLDRLVRGLSGLDKKSVKLENSSQVRSQTNFLILFYYLRTPWGPRCCSGDISNRYFLWETVTLSFTVKYQRALFPKRNVSPTLKWQHRWSRGSTPYILTKVWSFQVGTFCNISTESYFMSKLKPKTRKKAISIFCKNIYDPSHPKRIPWLWKSQQKRIDLVTGLGSSQHGFTFRVTMKDEKAIRGKSGIITVDTNKTGVRFRNSQLETLNKEYQGLMEGYESKQEEIVKEIMEIVCGYSENFSQLGAIVSRLGMVTTQHFPTEFTIACTWSIIYFHPNGGGHLDKEVV